MEDCNCSTAVGSVFSLIFSKVVVDSSLSVVS